jgi:hypothetical protein
VLKRLAWEWLFIVETCSESWWNKGCSCADKNVCCICTSLCEDSGIYVTVENDTSEVFNFLFFDILLPVVTFICSFNLISFTVYLEPLLHELSPVAHYTIKSQWLYFVTLNVQPKLVTDTSGYGHQHYALAEDILPQIITPLEKKLGMLFHVYHYMC